MQGDVIDGGVLMNHSQTPYEQPSRPESVPMRGQRPADPGYGYPSDRNAADNTRRNAYYGRRMLKGAAGRAVPSAENDRQDAERLEWKRHRTDRDGIAEIPDEAEAIARRVARSSTSFTFLENAS